MKHTYYFMAGMPRSGSTLLSSILNQNPRFYSGPSSPVLSTMLNIEQHLLKDELYNAFPKENECNQLIGSVIDHFYDDIDKPVVIDKNRGWTCCIKYILGYIKCDAKIICPIRDIAEILTSFMMLIRRNGQIVDNKLNFIDEQLVKQGQLLTDENRCEFLLSDNGICGISSISLMDG